MEQTLSRVGNKEYWEYCIIVYTGVHENLSGKVTFEQKLEAGV